MLMVAIPWMVVLLTFLFFSATNISSRANNEGEGYSRELADRGPASESSST